MSIILDALRAVVNLKQKDNESLQDYTRRFKTAKDVLVSHLGGPIVLFNTVKSLDDSDPWDPLFDYDKFNKNSEKAFQQLLAFTYLENADKAKYGTILSGLQTQQSLGNNQYPMTIIEANNVLSEHKHDNAGKTKLTKANNMDKDNQEEPLVLCFMQMEGRCYCCGKKGHKSPNCKHQDKPKDEWAINKAKVQEEQSQANVDATGMAQLTNN
jgi:hypothetical protein